MTKKQIIKQLKLINAKVALINTKTNNVIGYYDDVNFATTMLSMYGSETHDLIFA